MFLRYITTSIVLSFVHYMTIWLGQHQPPPTSYKADAARAHYLPTCCRSPAPCSAHLARCIPQHQHSINITGIPQHCFHISHCLPVCSAKHMHTKLQDSITKIVPVCALLPVYSEQIPCGSLFIAFLSVMVLGQECWNGHDTVSIHSLR